MTALKNALDTHDGVQGCQISQSKKFTYEISFGRN